MSAQGCIALVTPVIFVDKEFVICIRTSGTAWALPSLEIPTKHSVNTVLKQFMRDAFDMDLAHLVDTNRVRAYTVYGDIVKDQRLYQHSYIIDLSSTDLHTPLSPDAGLVSVQEVIHAPASVVNTMHRRMIQDCYEVGK